MPRITIELDDDMHAKLLERFPNRQERGGFVRGAIHRALESKRPVAKRKHVPGRLPAGAESLLSLLEQGVDVDVSQHRKELQLLIDRKRVIEIAGRYYPA